MENHGIIVWGKDVEDAYWKMENVDSYCKTVWIASQLAGGNLHQISTGGLRDLIALRKKLGMPDTRDDSMKKARLIWHSRVRRALTRHLPLRIILMGFSRKTLLAMDHNAPRGCTGFDLSGPDRGLQVEPPIS